LNFEARLFSRAFLSLGQIDKDVLWGDADKNASRLFYFGRADIGDEYGRDQHARYQVNTYAGFSAPPTETSNLA